MMIPLRADQSEAVGAGSECLPAVASVWLVALCDQRHQARVRVTDDLVELDSRVSVTEVACPAAREPVRSPGPPGSYPDRTHPEATTSLCRITIT